VTGSSSFELRYTERARQNIADLDGSIRKRLRKILEGKLAIQPSQHGKPLVGKLAGYWSHRFAAHRVIYRIYEDLRLVVICAVGPRLEGDRGDVYRQLQAVVDAGRAAEDILSALGDPPGHK